ncbi:DUF4255 domain-containing protein [Ruegeria sp. MALMAid1280]|uniref:DUF4255 domain-containing protein n=1 Tax=Ruegeria sp. MALMAid1280 TaxID=3411634 RepID=UPI003BA0A6DC
MSANAIAMMTEALRSVLEATVSGTVFTGPPSDSQAGSATASLFLYHLEPNADLRNSPYLDGLRSRGAPGTGEPEGNPPSAAIPFDLRYIISVSREPGLAPGSSPNELITLGQIIQALHATPVLTGAKLPGQTVRVTPDPVSMEEISRVWSLFPETPYRTSIVYLATPVFVDADEALFGQRVLEVTRSAGRLEEASS